MRYENRYIWHDLIRGLCALLVCAQRLRAVWLSQISFTLYLFHFPVVLLIFAAFYSKNKLL